MVARENAPCVCERNGCECNRGAGRSRGLLLAVEVIVGVFRAAAMAARASDLFSEVTFSRRSLPITLRPPLLLVVFFSCFARVGVVMTVACRGRWSA